RLCRPSSIQIVGIGIFESLDKVDREGGVGIGRLEFTPRLLGQLAIMEATYQVIGPLTHFMRQVVSRKVKQLTTRTEQADADEIESQWSSHGLPPCKRERTASANRAWRKAVKL